MSFETKVMIALGFAAIIAVNWFVLREARKQFRNIDTEILKKDK